jgi:AraC family transcriptional regulator of adaptative response / DNA-3-methyladenine glycosylase II
MELDASRCYRALRSRDARFDGRFFVGVTSTGIYCRPICPAPTPKPRNVLFFSCAAAAQTAGFRPCLRCRPETAPGTPAWVGTSAVVSRALRLLAQGALDEGDVESLAARLGLGARHLRRLFDEHLGASPKAIWQAQRAHFARRLIDETRLPMSEIASSAGFRSIRQFNHAMRQTFGAAPTTLRQRTRPQATAPDLTVRLPFRPPLDWTRLLAYLAGRAVGGVESVRDDTYRRTITVGDVPGLLTVRRAARDANHLLLSVDGPGTASLFETVARVRRIFDLDADPRHVIAHLRRDPALAGRVRRAPGVRLPGTWDPFELAVRAILGQQVSVPAATTMAGRLAARFGTPLATSDPALTHVFPTAAVLRAAPVERIGLPAARAAAIRALAAAIDDGTVLLDGSQSLDTVIEGLCALPGVGPWTANYVAMRGLGEPDAFPAGDLGLRRALANGAGLPTPAALLTRAERWRPWRGYAAMHLWQGGE